MSDFYFDENVSAITQGHLTSLGHSVVPATRLLAMGSDDHLQLAMSVRLERILVTANAKDFMLLHLAWHAWFAEWGTPPLPRHAGILIIDQPPILAHKDAAEMIHSLVTELASAAMLANRCFRLRSHRGWREVE